MRLGSRSGWPFCHVGLLGTERQPPGGGGAGGWGRGLQLRASMEWCPGWARGFVRSLLAGMKPRGSQTGGASSAWGCHLCCPGFPSLSALCWTLGLGHLPGWRPCSPLTMELEGQQASSGLGSAGSRRLQHAWIRAALV